MELDNDVINHLLFHKALIDENNDMSRINQYLEMAKAAATGQTTDIENQFDRSVYLAFDLVLNQHMNPWDIDLVGFSTMYLKRAKKEKIDLLTAGKIIYMAWKVLRMQSDHLVVNMETKEEDIDQGFGWEDIPTSTWLANDDEYSYTNLLMKMPQPPLEEPIRRDSTRKVTLIELLSAFDEARKESEQYQLLDHLREEERILLQQKARKKMKGSAHEDHLEEDVASVWERICQFPKKSMNFTELCDMDSAEERIKTFISILFLAYENKIIVHQQKFPYGEIFIKTIGYT
ncbi:MAG: segregation/condensation protein A [Candidatus Thermoplasmatota archaeon]|nr:segregation/condensation protein A [Candidatus Thermoplasmatota archaeon]